MDLYGRRWLALGACVAAGAGLIYFQWRHRTCQPSMHLAQQQEQQQKRHEKEQHDPALTGQAVSAEKPPRVAQQLVTRMGDFTDVFEGAGEGENEGEEQERASGPNTDRGLAQLGALMHSRRRQQSGDAAVGHPAVLGQRKVRLLQLGEAQTFNSATCSPVLAGFEWRSQA